MNNQNGYNYNGIVPNNNQVPTNSGQPNYGGSQPSYPQTSQAQPNYNQPVQPVSQVQNSYIAQATQQVPLQSANVVQPTVAVNNQLQQQNVNQVSRVEQVPVQPVVPTPPINNVGSGQSYPTPTQGSIPSQVSYPQTQAVKITPQPSYAQVSMANQPQQMSYPQQSQTLSSQTVSYAQQTPAPQTTTTSSVPNSVPTNPIIDLNHQTPVMPIEQTIAQPNSPEKTNIPSIFVPNPEITGDNSNEQEKDKKIKFKIPNLSKKQLIIIAAALIGIVLLVVISTVVGKGTSGNKPGNNGNGGNNSNISGSKDDSYKELPMDNWQSYKFQIHDKELSLPISYSELSSVSGFKMKTNYKNQKLDKNNYMSVNLYRDKKLSLYTEIYNGSNDNVSLQNGTITRIGQTYEQVKKGAEAVIFPANLKVGMEMTKESLVKLLGEPSNIKNYSSDNYVNNAYIYYATNNRTSVNYYEVKIVNDVIDQITLDHRG